MRHGGNVWQGGKPSDWLDFSANLRPEGPPDWVKAVFRRALEDVRYYPELEMEAAKEGLSVYAGVSAERILPTAGGIAALDLALLPCKREVVVDQPEFGEYAARAAVHGRKCVNKTSIYMQEGAARVLSNPNNPTGAAVSREGILKEFSDITRSGGELIVDEAFIDYCPECSVRGDVQKGLTVIGSLTKILCIPGVRLGYICAEEEAVARLTKAALPWQLNAFAALTAAELPKHLDDIRADAKVNEHRRERFAAMLRSLEVRVLPSKANFLLCDFGRDMGKAVEKLRSRHILVRECASFGLGTNYLRLAVRTEEENECLMKELEKCLES